MTKLNNSNWDKTQKLKLWQNSQTQYVLVKTTWHLQNRWDFSGQLFAISRCFFMFSKLPLMIALIALIALNSWISQNSQISPIALINLTALTALTEEEEEGGVLRRIWLYLVLSYFKNVFPQNVWCPGQLNIARSQKAAQSTSHLLSRCQVVLTKRLF